MSISQYKNYDRLLLAVDCIIFGFDGNKLQALLVKRNFEPRKNNWSLMGGFIKKEESVDDAAKRILLQLTGLENIYMEQLYCFGKVNRDLGGRVISLAYFALIKVNGNSRELMDEHDAQWFELNKIPKLLFDHKEMIELAKIRLREKVSNHPVGFELLPEKFTLQQLQNLYEAIYETSFDRRNFSRKILGLQIFQKLDEKEKQSSKKGAYYYVFDKVKYKKLEKEGLRFI